MSFFDLFKKPRKNSYPVKSFEDEIEFVKETRDYFWKILKHSDSNKELNEIFKLFFDFADEIAKNTSTADDRRYSIAIIIKAIRILFASFFTFESGFYFEAHSILRNYMELLLNAADVGYNKESLNRWLLTKIDDEHHEFKPSRCFERIIQNSKCPQLEKDTAAFIYKEWKDISNKSVHEHSLENISQVMAGEALRLADRKSKEVLEENLLIYKRLCLNALTILIGVSRYNEEVQKNPAKFPHAVNLKRRYEGYLSNIQLLGRSMNQHEIKRVLDEAERLGFDYSSIPKDAKISHATMNRNDQEKDSLIVTYFKPKA